MKSISLPASVYSSIHASNQKPELNWLAMKEKLGALLARYNTIVEEDQKHNPNSKLKKLAVSMENTAKNILWLFMQKFSKGKVKHGTVKFTYSYLANSVGKEFRSPAIITVTRHIQRFLQMPNSFIRAKERSTLGIPGKDVNCISITLDPRVIVYKNPLHQKAHEDGTEIILQPKIVPKSTSEPILNQPQFFAMPKTEAQKVVHKAAPIGDVLGSIFSKFTNPNSPQT